MLQEQNNDGVLDDVFKSLFSECESYWEEYQRLKELSGEDAEDLRDIYCNEMLYRISRGYTKYDFEGFEKLEPVQVFLKAVELLPGKTCTIISCITFSRVSITGCCPSLARV